jgi:signal transduction histidine kinase
MQPGWQTLGKPLSNTGHEQLEALSKLGPVVSSTLDLETVLTTVVARATQFAGADAALISEYDERSQEFRPRASHNLEPEIVGALRRAPLRKGEGAVGRLANTHEPVQIPDLARHGADPSGLPGDITRFGHRALLAVPLVREGQIIGGLVICRKIPGEFSQDVIDFLMTFAAQSALAIQNARLYAETKRREWEATKLYEISTQLASSLDADHVLDLITTETIGLLGGDASGLYTYDAERGGLTFHRGIHLDPELLRDLVLTPGEGVAGRAFQERRPVWTGDRLTDPALQYTPAAAPLVGSKAPRAYLAVPILSRGEVYGVLVDYFFEPHDFTPNEIRLLSSLADHAAIALENVRLLEELQSRTRELGQSVAELKALGEVSQAVSSTLDLRTVLATIVARAVQLSGTSGGIIYEYDEAAEQLHPRATHRTEEELVEVLRTAPLRLGEGAAGKAVATRAPVQVRDILDEYAVTRIRTIFTRYGYRSLLAVPLLLEQRILGALVVWRQESGSFAPELVNLLQTFAGQSVLAIQNARLFREIEEKGQQLEIASKHKSQFLANMSHELRTPLNAILGYTKMIQSDIYGPVPETIRDVVGRLEQSGRHLLGLINDVLDFSKIEAGQLTLALTDYSMKDVVQAVLAAAESLAAEKKLRLTIMLSPDLPVGKGDQRRIVQVLLNLVGNAIKFTEAGEVTVQATTSDGAFVVSVRDTGPGISPADQQRIFEEFQQVDSSNTRRKGGTGLGLSIAKRIIELHGGRLWVESAPGEGSTFWFSLPVRVERPPEPS